MEHDQPQIKSWRDLPPIWKRRFFRYRMSYVDAGVVRAEAAEQVALEMVLKEMRKAQQQETK